VQDYSDRLMSIQEYDTFCWNQTLRLKEAQYQATDKAVHVSNVGSHATGPKRPSMDQQEYQLSLPQKIPQRP